MSQPRENTERVSAGSLSELFNDYLERQVVAQSEGLGFAEPGEEVLPYDCIPVQPVDPKLAWEETRGILKAHGSLPAPRTLPAPPDWPQLVADHEPAVALAFALGNFPQLVRNLQPMLAGSDLTAHRPTPQRSLAGPALLDWASRQTDPLNRLLAAGALRLAREYTRASEILKTMPSLEGEWKALWVNETAALAWHQGKAEEALTLWRGQEETVPVLFNLGMAALFLGKAAEARDWLRRAVAGLPDTSSWHHLGQLYLAMAQTRI
jgi:tetratricopeptide (TPR) repeat protein